MIRYSRWLFGSAATFNIAIGSVLLFFASWLGSLLHIDASAGSAMVAVNLAGGFVALFGVAFALVAADPSTYRPYVLLGAVGKIMAVAIVAANCFFGAAPMSVLAIVSGDLVFAALFIDFLRRSGRSLRRYAA